MTKRGLAPPSDPPAPTVPATEELPSPRAETPEQPSCAAAGGVTQDSPTTDEQKTRSESSVVALREVEHRAADSSDRARFKTAPGGGKNRISGGRVAAAAYVSPSTVAPGHHGDRDDPLVKVHESVVKEAVSFPTEPSLLRRRASSMPPPPPESSTRNAVLFGLGLVGSLGFGGLGVWFFQDQWTDQGQLETPSPSGPTTAANDSGNAIPSRPKDGSRAASPTQPTPQELPAETAQPSSEKTASTASDASALPDHRSSSPAESSPAESADRAPRRAADTQSAPRPPAPAAPQTESPPEASSSASEAAQPEPAGDAELWLE